MFGLVLDRGSPSMGLNISPGRLADLRVNDPDAAADLRKLITSANRTLKANGLRTHAEPEDLPGLPERFNRNSVPYGWFDRLKRAVAYAVPAEKFKPLPTGKDAAEDSWVIQELCTRSRTLSVTRTATACTSRWTLTRRSTASERAMSLTWASARALAGLRELVLTAPLLGIELNEGYWTQSSCGGSSGRRRDPTYLRLSVKLGWRFSKHLRLASSTRQRSCLVDFGD